MRFFGHQNRDVRVVHTSDRDNRSAGNTTIKPRSDGVVYHHDAFIHFNSSTDFSNSSKKFYSSGVHLLGPNEIADEGGTRTLYRVIANGFTSSNAITISVGFARSPDTPTDGVAGDAVTKHTYLCGGFNDLYYDDLVAVDPWPTADEAKAICFYVYTYNTSSSTVTGQAAWNLAVARLVGPRPMMHDQRIQ